MSGLHLKEYRLYRLLWLLIPMGLVWAAYSFPALRPAPLIRIEIEESDPDYLYLAGEDLYLSFRSLDLSNSGLNVSWWFGAPILVQKHADSDSAEIQLLPKVDWIENEKDSLGLPKIGIIYDTLYLDPGIWWDTLNSFQSPDPTVRFPTPGKFILKLLVEDTVNAHQLEHSLLIEIHEAPRISRHDTTVNIIGPSKGLVEEELLFFATGNQASYWYWKFGDKKNLDADQQQVIYSFDQAGTYRLKMRTDLSEDWITHDVVISPTWNADSLPELEQDTSQLILDQTKLDIRKRLQAIADAPPEKTGRYYANKEYIEQQYIPIDLRPIDVWIEGEEESVDFESYCQRIHFLEGELLIEEVDLEWAYQRAGSKISTLFITQKKASN